MGAIEDVGEILNATRRGRKTLCDEFSARYAAELAVLATLKKIPRFGRCKDGLRYSIHGNGYTVHFDEDRQVDVHGRGWASAVRPVQPEDGIFDRVDVFSVQLDVESWSGHRYEISEIQEACQEYCHRGILRFENSHSFELFQEDQIEANARELKAERTETPPASREHHDNTGS